MLKSRLTLVALIFGFAAAPLHAQAATSDSAAVLAVMKRLFDGMRTGDSAMVRSTFHPKMSTMTTAVVKQGAPTADFGNLDGFTKAIGTPHAEAYDERTYNPEVRIDGTLATIWVEYSFFVGAKFSHCGIDAFQLVKEGTEWKIVAIADTRRKTGCRES
jgi:hypothetical protein